MCHHPASAECTLLGVIVRHHPWLLTVSEPVASRCSPSRRSLIPARNADWLALYAPLRSYRYPYFARPFSLSLAKTLHEASVKGLALAGIVLFFLREKSQTICQCVSPPMRAGIISLIDKGYPSSFALPCRAERCRAFIKRAPMRAYLGAS